MPTTSIELDHIGDGVITGTVGDGDGGEGVFVGPGKEPPLEPLLPDVLLAGRTTTVICTLMPSLLAVIRAVPAATAVTFPVELTVTVDRFPLCHSTPESVPAGAFWPLASTPLTVSCFR
jgi:hypothetical protein